MKRLIPFLFIAATCLGQVRVNCSQLAVCTLATNLRWSSANQTFVFSPQFSTESILISVHNNNTTTAHTQQTVAVFQTASVDQSISPTLNGDRWVRDKVTQNKVEGSQCNNVAINNPATLGGSGMGTCYVASVLAGQIAVQITGAVTQAGSPDTVDLTVVQSPTNSAPSGAQPGNDPNGTLCDQVQSNSVAAAGTMLVTLPAGATRLAVCGWTLSITALPAAAAPMSFLQGTGATCNTNQTILNSFEFGTSISNPLLSYSEHGSAPLFYVTQGLNFCVFNNSGVVGNISVVFAIIS